MFFLFACQEVVTYEDATIEMAEISTVFTVTWSSEVPTRGWVEYGRGEELTRKTDQEVQAGTEHAIVVAGLPEGSDWSWRIAQENEEGEVIYGDVHPYEVGAAPAGVEGLQVDTKPLNKAGFILVPVDNQKTVVMYDLDGNVVWWYQLEDTGFLSQARWVDGRIWFNHFPKEDTPDNYIYSVSLDQEDVVIYTVPNGHHDFLVNGSNLLFLQRDLRTGPDGTPWVGDRVVVRDLDQLEADGDRELWSTWDFVAQEGGDSSFYSDGWDWTHCNSLTTIPETGEILVSSKMQEAFYAISPEGTVSWVAGGTQSTFSIGGDSSFGILHGLAYVDDQLWLYDNRPKDRKLNSRVVAYTIDRNQNALIENFSEEADGLGNFVHGNGEPTGDGRILGAWGKEGRMMLWDEEGNVEAQFEGGELGYAHFIPQLGGPKK